MFKNAGQDCCAGTRIPVHQQIYPEVVDRLKAAAAAQQIGNTFDDGVTMGPLISPRQCQRVHGYTSQAQSQGATLVTGGHPLTEDKPAGSSFYEPTLFTDVTPDTTIFQEEVFGPVGVIVPFTSEDEVVTLANQSTYGLAAAVYANDLGTAHRVAQRVEAGMVWINEFNAHAMEMPFGGYKQSGIGKDYSMHALDS